MNKYFTFTLAFSFAVVTIFAQAKKYVLVEHFTNTYCPICSSQNPDFYQRIGVETNTKVHHISIHSSVPYPQCPFYQANKTEQDFRKDFYTVLGTPRVSLNGAALVSAAEVTAANIDAATAGTSPLELKVTETTGTSRTATITFKSLGTTPPGNYRLYAAVVEKKINFNANNSETVHHNVFRKFLSNGVDIPYNGIPITLTNNIQTIQVFYDVSSLWNAAQTYVVVWVQNETTKEVLNSATRFDIQSATNESSIDTYVNVVPNPTSAKTMISFTQVTPQYLTVQNAIGQILEVKKLTNSEPLELDLTQYAPGILFIKVQAHEGSTVKSVVKQ